MTHRLLGYLIAAVLIGAAALGYYSGCQRQVVDKAQIEAQELKGKVDALTQEAEKHKALADQAQSTVAVQDGTIAALKAKLAKIQHQPVQIAPVVPDAPDTADGLKDQIIEAQDTQIATLKGEVGELRTSMDLLGEALATEQRRSRGLEIALDAQKHASKSGKWLGRLQGFAVGVAVGFGGGKLVWR